MMAGTSGKYLERCLLLMASGFTLSEPINGFSSTGLAGQHLDLAGDQIR